MRGFVARKIPSETLTRVVSAALQAPSGGNLQPWRIYAVSGSRLDDLKSRIRRRIDAGDMDTGIFLQSIMLLLRAEGVDSCGMSIGYADQNQPQPDMPRASLSEIVTFLDS